MIFGAHAAALIFDEKMSKIFVLLLWVAIVSTGKWIFRNLSGLVVFLLFFIQFRYLWFLLLRFWHVIVTN